MPFQFDEATTPNGLRYLVIDVSGWVDIADGHALQARLQPGQPHHRGFVLSRTTKGTEYSPEVRKFFRELEGYFAAIGVVVTSPLVRAAINLMLRFSGNKGTVRMFTSEAEAVAWLESCARSRDSTSR
jgi:hypothetical protein